MEAETILNFKSCELLFPSIPIGEIIKHSSSPLIIPPDNGKQKFL